MQKKINLENTWEQEKQIQHGRTWFIRLWDKKNIVDTRISNGRIQVKYEGYPQWYYVHVSIDIDDEYNQRQIDSLISKIGHGLLKVLAAIVS